MLLAGTAAAEFDVDLYAGVLRDHTAETSRLAGTEVDYEAIAGDPRWPRLLAGLEAARPGNLCEDVANAFFAVLAKAGVHKDNRTGYPIGLSYPPDWGERTMSLRPGDKSVLEPGMTFHFMTGVWAGEWGLEITESIAITEIGCECLANVPRKLLVKD